MYALTITRKRPHSSHSECLTRQKVLSPRGLIDSNCDLTSVTKSPDCIGLACPACALARMQDVCNIRSLRG